MFMRFALAPLLMILLFAVFIYCVINVDNNAPKKSRDESRPTAHWKRACAFLIDIAVIGGFIFMMMQFYKMLNVDRSTTVLYYFFNYLYFFIVIGYGFIQEAIYSSTLGKLLLGIRVENMDGNNISWQAAYVRNAFKFLNGLGLVDYIVALVRDDHRRLGDLAARTRVS